MSDEGTGSQRGSIATSRPILIAMLTVAAMLIAVSAVLFEAPHQLGRKKVPTDFDAFYAAGTMANAGEASSAYRTDAMFATQRRMTGTIRFLPWTYPPPFTAFVAVLARLPLGVAYVIFTTFSLGFYFLVLRRIAGPYLPGVLVALMPTVVLLARTGQNGFLTGGLVGLFVLGFLDRRASAGVPLGLMIIKPHLTAALALMTLLERRWATALSAAAVVAGALAISTLAFGWSIWPAFMGGVRESGRFLADGEYPLFRMSSVYATVRSLDFAPSIAFALHGVVAVGAIAVFLRLWRKRIGPRLLAAAGCVASLFVSPYNYDYDLTILGVAIALIVPDLVAKLDRLRLALLTLLTWFVTGYGLALSGYTESRGNDDGVPSLIAPAFLALVVLGTVWLRRRAARDTAPALALGQAGA